MATVIPPLTTRIYPMRKFASAFLLLFTVDAGLSFFDELVSLFFPLPALSGFRNFLANVVIVTAVALYFSLGIDKRLPKRVFLPLILFLCLCPIAPLIFPPLSGSGSFGMLAASVQLLLGMLTISHFRKPKGRGIRILPEAMFGTPFFSARNTLIFGGINIVVIPAALVLLTLLAVNAFMAKHTSGFMRLAPDGLHMAEKVYRRGNRTVRLAAMIHVGEKRYYEEMGSVAPGRTIVLAEGVTDDKHVLPNRLDYGKVADYLGLTLQQDNLHFKGRQIAAAELEKPRSQPGAESAGQAGQVDILRADVDVSSFRPPTLQFLDGLGKQMKESPSLAKGLLASSAWSNKFVTPETQTVIMDDILYHRNKEVIRHLRKALQRYDTVVIPWGALHMPEIEAEVLKQGFQLQQVRERVSIDFVKMLESKS
jgi:hypothetical protein